MHLIWNDKLLLYDVLPYNSFFSFPFFSSFSSRKCFSLARARGKNNEMMWLVWKKYYITNNIQWKNLCAYFLNSFTQLRKKSVDTFNNQSRWGGEKTLEKSIKNKAKSLNSHLSAIFKIISHKNHAQLVHLLISYFFSFFFCKIIRWKFFFWFFFCCDS